MDNFNSSGATSVSDISLVFPDNAGLQFRW